MKLLLAVPTYGPVEPKASRHLRVAIMHAAKHGGVEWVGDLSPDKMGWEASRNTIVQGAVNQTEAEAIFWADSDVVLPPEAITRLVLAQKDFVCGIYCQRIAPHWPLIAHFDDKRKHFNWFMEWPENVLAPIDGCGFGCVLTSTAMLKAMPAPWFTFEQFSEDFDFCLRAAKAGYQLFVDTGVLCGHLMDPQPATVEDYLKLRDSGALARHIIRPADSAA